VEGKYDRALELPDVSALLALGETGFDLLMISEYPLLRESQRHWKLGEVD